MNTVKDKMYNRKIALFDLDDTLINIKEVMYQTLKAEYGGVRVPHWSLWDNFNLEHLLGISLDELIAVSNKHQTFMIAEPHLFSPYLLKDLRARGWYVIILTARGGFVPNAYEVTEKYLRDNDLVYDELIVTDVGQNKMDGLLHHDSIVFTVDDQVKNCDMFKASGKFEHVFLHAQAYNRGNSDYVRLHNLYQVYHHLGIN